VHAKAVVLKKQHHDEISTAREWLGWVSGPIFGPPVLSKPSSIAPVQKSGMPETPIA
jgi:hypothetical protein